MRGTCKHVATLALIISLALPALTLAAVCPTLTHTIARGAKGPDVTALQQLLVSQGLLTSDSATGFFGVMTEAAVQKFQASHNLASSGTPSTTGYGSVGAKTRAAIGLACSNTHAATSASQTPTATKSAPPSTLQPNCPLVSLPIGKACTGQWKEVKDAQGCTASWQCQ